MKKVLLLLAILVGYIAYMSDTLEASSQCTKLKDERTAWEIRSRPYNGTSYINYMEKI